MAMDVSAFTIRVALEYITKSLAEGHQASSSLLTRCLRILQQEALDPTQNELLLSCFAERNLENECLSMTQLIPLLLEADRSVATEDLMSGMLIWNLLYYSRGRPGPDVGIVDALSILIETGFDVNYMSQRQKTLSMYARQYDRWSPWCKALQSTGKSIEAVLSQEGNSWLLQKDWRRIWQERCIHGYKELKDLDSIDEVLEDGENKDYEANSPE